MAKQRMYGNKYIRFVKKERRDLACGVVSLMYISDQSFILKNILFY